MSIRSSTPRPEYIPSAQQPMQILTLAESLLHEDQTHTDYSEVNTKDASNDQRLPIYNAPNTLFSTPTSLISPSPSSVFNTRAPLSNASEYFDQSTNGEQVYDQPPILGTASLNDESEARSQRTAEAETTVHMPVIVQFGTVSALPEGGYSPVCPAVKDFSGFPAILNHIASMTEILEFQEQHFLITYGYHRLTLRDTVGYMLFTISPVDDRYHPIWWCFDDDDWCQAVQLVYNTYHTIGTCQDQLNCLYCRKPPMIVICFDTEQFSNALSSKGIDPVHPGLTFLDLPEEHYARTLFEISNPAYLRYENICHTAQTVRQKVGLGRYDTPSIFPFGLQQRSPVASMDGYAGQSRQTQNFSSQLKALPLIGHTSYLTHPHNSTYMTDLTDLPIANNDNTMREYSSDGSTENRDPKAQSKRRKLYGPFTTGPSNGSASPASVPPSSSMVRGSNNMQVIVSNSQSSSIETRDWSKAVEKPIGNTKNETDHCLTCIQQGRHCRGTHLIAWKGNWRCQNCSAKRPDGTGGRKCYWKNAAAGISTYEEAKSADPRAIYNNENTAAAKEERRKQQMESQETNNFHEGYRSVPHEYLDENTIADDTSPYPPL